MHAIITSFSHVRSPSSQLPSFSLRSPTSPCLYSLPIIISHISHALSLPHLCSSLLGYLPLRLCPSLYGGGDWRSPFLPPSIIRVRVGGWRGASGTSKSLYQHLFYCWWQICSQSWSSLPPLSSLSLSSLSPSQPLRPPFHPLLPSQFIPPLWYSMWFFPFIPLFPP